MKLTCQCGHPNHVHFAGLRRCHLCDCSVFRAVVSVAPELTREDLK